MTGERRRSPVRGRVLDAGLQQLVRRGLRGTWVRGELPLGGVVWAANHHSWWDGFLAGAVLHREDRPAALLMDGDNLAAFGFLRAVGVLPAQHLRAALHALRDGRVLVIFPEGDLRGPGPIGGLARGAAWLATRAPAALVPVAVRVVNRGHQHAEALIDIGTPVAGDALAATLSSRLSALDDLVRDADPRLPLPGFRAVVPGRSSWDEHLSRWAGRVRR